MEEKTQEEILAEADRLAAEVEAELADNIGDMSALPEGLELTPEMLENMDPAQLQQFLAQFGGQKQKLAQSYYTRSAQTTKAQRKKKRKAQKRARAITRRDGWGRTISTKRRKRKAA